MPVSPPPKITTGAAICASFAVTIGGPDLPWNGTHMHKAPEPGAIERGKELDRENRRSLRGGLPLTLSLRYLATALDRLRTGTQLVASLPVARPTEGMV